MDITGVTAVVTGANRGLGRAFAEGLLARGAQKVYAAARRPSRYDDRRIVGIELDITRPEQVSAAAARCGDANLLVNNAGIMMLQPLLAAPNMTAAQTEMETNYFGTLSMCREFAPVLGRNGGGAVVNVLSAASWYALPFNGSYCASKSAQWSLTNAIRTELRAQGTLVVGVYSGFIDTEMSESVVGAAKISSQDVVAQTIDAVMGGHEEVLADEVSREIRNSLPRHLTTMYPKIQQQWDQGRNPWGPRA
ncbi:MAG: SDR family NAD(P)-dependent oxidoreductase [Hyphomicrobiales bacterium]|nr:MAG: SDR family NAD(P)-dependent oxidoreductase [Hyphomicrobiales bacterium]